MELRIPGPNGPRNVYAYTGGKAFEPTLPPIVFIHGALHDHSVWTLLARWFAHHGRSVLAIDLPGHGRSPGAPLPSVEAAADGLLALLDSAGVSRAALVGHSMGSMIALEAAGRAPARVRRLVLLGTAYPMRVSAALLDTARDDPATAIDRVNVFSHSGIAPKPSFPGPGSWMRGGNRALMRRIQAGQTGCNLFRHDFGVCDAYAGGFEAAARVGCPTDFILGNKDQMTSPSQAAELAAMLSATVHRVDAGHALMTEAPDAVLSLLRQAL